MNWDEVTDEELNAESARRDKKKSDVWVSEYEKSRREKEARIERKFLTLVTAVVPDITDEQIELIKDAYFEYYSEMY